MPNTKKCTALQLFNQKQKIEKAESKVWEEKEKLHKMTQNTVVNDDGQFITVGNSLYNVKVQKRHGVWRPVELTIEKIGDLDEIKKVVP